MYRLPKSATTIPPNLVHSVVYDKASPLGVSKTQVSK